MDANISIEEEKNAVAQANTWKKKWISTRIEGQLRSFKYQRNFLTLCLGPKSWFNKEQTQQLLMKKKITEKFNFTQSPKHTEPVANVRRSI